jgi:hypothetical protein
VHSKSRFQSPSGKKSLPSLPILDYHTQSQTLAISTSEYGDTPSYPHLSSNPYQDKEIPRLSGCSPWRSLLLASQRACLLEHVSLYQSFPSTWTTFDIRTFSHHRHGLPGRASFEIKECQQGTDRFGFGRHCYRSAPQRTHRPSSIPASSTLTPPLYLSHYTLLSSTTIHRDLLDTRVSFHKTNKQQYTGHRHRSLSTLPPLIHPTPVLLCTIQSHDVFHLTPTHSTYQAKFNTDYSACFRNALLYSNTTQVDHSHQRDDTDINKG